MSTATATNNTADNFQEDPALATPRNSDTTILIAKDGKQRVTFQNSPFLMHPDVAALGIPTPKSDEFQRLYDDIKATGRIRDVVKIAKDTDGTEYIVDGWNRMHIADDLKFVRGKDYKVEFIQWNEAAAVAKSSILRRNLTEGETVKIAQNLLEIEKREAAARQAAAARTTNLLKSSEAPAVVEVESTRISAGGDVANTYSVDSIVTKSKTATSQIRGTFEYQGKAYAAVDGFPGSSLVCYQVVTPDEFKETGASITNYVKRAEELQTNPGLGLDGLLVALRITEGEGDDAKDVKVQRVLQGPPLIFKSAEAPEAEDGDGKSKKKDNKPVKAADKVAKQTGMSTRAIEMMDFVRKNDPEAMKRIENSEKQLDADGNPTKYNETINSAYQRILAQRNAKEFEKSSQKDPNALPGPSDMTLKDFVQKHPLYEQLKGNEIFVRDVTAFFFAWNALIALGKALGQGKARYKVNENESTFFKRANSAANIAHPYTWTLADEKGENGELVNPGGYAFKNVAPKPPTPKPTPEEKAKAKTEAAVATKGKPNPKPTPKAKAEVKGGKVSEEENGEPDGPTAEDLEALAQMEAEAANASLEADEQIDASLEGLGEDVEPDNGE